MRAFLALSLVVMTISAACFSATAQQTSPPRLIRPEQASTAAVQVEQQDYKFNVDRSRASAGTIDFVVRNGGHQDHEFVIVRVKNGRYGLPIGEIGAFAPGETRAIRADLSSGEYALVCLMVSVEDNEPQSHMALGMRAMLEVTG